MSMSAETAPDTGDPTVESTTDTTERHLHPVPPVPDTTGEEAAQRVADTGEAESAGTAASESPTSTDGGEVVSSRFDLSGWIEWTQTTFRPDSGLFSERPLASDEVLDRAKRGSQLADAGPLRTAAIADSYIAATAKAVLRCGDWLLDHPARRLVAAVLLAGLLAYPPTRVAIGYALTPIAALSDLLT